MTYTAIHRALGRDPSPITAELLAAAVSEGVEETEDLDWKSKLSPAKELTTSDWPKDVAAMANSGGGLLVYGVKEDQKAATGRIDIGDLDEHWERSLRAVAASAITPPVVDLKIDKVGAGTERAVVVEIPASLDSPHLIYRNQFFGAPIRNGADTRWMKERELEAAYRARFDERRHAYEALSNLTAETAAGRDTNHRAWLIFAAHPRIPLLATDLDAAAATTLMNKAWLFSSAITHEKGIHPLEVVDRHSPRPGLRRWVARYRPAGSDRNWDEAWISVHRDGSVTAAAAIGGHRTRGGFNDGSHVESTAIEAALADTMGLVRATAERTHNSSYDIRVDIRWTGEEPLMLTTTDNFKRAGRTDYTVPLHQYTPVEVTLDAREPERSFAEHTADLARDCINQGGIAALQLIKPSAIADDGPRS